MARLLHSQLFFIIMIYQGKPSVIISYKALMQIYTCLQILNYVCQYCAQLASKATIKISFYFFTIIEINFLEVNEKYYIWQCKRKPYNITYIFLRSILIFCALCSCCQDIRNLLYKICILITQMCFSSHKHLPTTCSHSNLCLISCHHTWWIN